MKKFGFLFIYIVMASLCGAFPLYAAEFNEERAFEHMRTICSFGPRVPGTAGHAQCRDYITHRMESYGYTVYHQTFNAHATLLGKNIRFTNIIAYKEPLSTGTVAVLSSHWDTRPIADHDPEPAMRTRPILGANDGASGNAVMLELARTISKQPYSHSLFFVYFDGEDLGTRSNLEEYCIGSRYLAQNPPDFFRFDFGINLDMVADENLLLKIEPYSYDAAPDIVDEVWEIGQREYPAHFSRDTWNPILDDHYPFISRGKSYINVIDFDYPWWHTMDDTLEHCSIFSIKVVGNTIFRYLGLKLNIL